MLGIAIHLEDLTRSVLLSKALNVLLMYTRTSAMAEDVIALLDYVGWRSGKRSLHVVGISLGGMIALGMVSLVYAV